jgi:cytidine deaminase
MTANNDVIQNAVERAREARERAHAPYSRFHVGAAVIDADGRIHAGCNVENASYGLTICAERNAVAAAVAAGATKLTTCVLITDTPEPVTPCGACRQVLSEFGADMQVVCTTLSGQHRSYGLRELLPEGFDAGHLR